MGKVMIFSKYYLNNPLIQVLTTRSRNSATFSTANSILFKILHMLFFLRVLKLNFAFNDIHPK